MQKQFFALTSGLLLLIFSTQSSYCEQSSGPKDYEFPPVFNAADLLGEVPLSSELYQIQKEVPTDGFLMAFTIDSKFGSFKAHSSAESKTILREIIAIEQLEEMEKSEVFLDGLEKSGKEIGKEVKTLVTEPVDTLKGVGAGIGRFFQRTYRVTKTGVQKIGDKISEEEPVSQGVPINSALPGAKTGEQEFAEEKGLTETSLNIVGNSAINIFGYNEQRRHIAKRLQVDPYTSNPVLSEKLDEVA
jgi:hypothetical protein